MPNHSPSKVQQNASANSSNFWYSKNINQVLQYINTNPGPYILEGITADELKMFFVVHQAKGMSDDGHDGTARCAAGRTGLEFSQVHSAFMEGDRDTRVELAQWLGTLLFDLVNYFHRYLIFH